MIKGIVPADRPLPALHNIISSSTNVFPLTSTLCLMSMISVYVTSQSQEPKQSGAAKTKEKVREGRGVFFYLWKRPLTDATMKFKFKEERTLGKLLGVLIKVLNYVREVNNGQKLKKVSLSEGRDTQSKERMTWFRSAPVLQNNAV